MAAGGMFSIASPGISDWQQTGPKRARTSAVVKPERARLWRRDRAVRAVAPVGEYAAALWSNSVPTARNVRVPMATMSRAAC
eukprot:scaffold12831_cov129-Isochrysis_galbana.AAC.4